MGYFEIERERALSVILGELTAIIRILSGKSIHLVTFSKQVAQSKRSRINS
jgi:hypothetical protein